MKRQSEIRDLLSANQIDYKYRMMTHNSQRGRSGSIGINLEEAVEYKFYVHKMDYERAIYLVQSIK